jgi:hypothetical protein
MIVDTLITAHKIASTPVYKLYLSIASIIVISYDCPFIITLCLYENKNNKYDNTINIT